MLKRKILLAEAENIISLDLQKFLQKKNFIISSVVTKGEDLISQYKFKKPDLIIADFNLKGEVKCANAIREIKKNDDIPVIIVSETLASNYNDDFNYKTPYRFLGKPFNHSELLDIITEYFPI
jgi:DNA-binding NtrC family response regulator